MSLAGDDSFREPRKRSLRALRLAAAVGLAGVHAAGSPGQTLGGAAAAGPDPQPEAALRLSHAVSSPAICLGDTVRVRLMVSNTQPAAVERVLVSVSAPSSDHGFLDLGWLLTPRTNLVKVSPWQTAAEGPANWGPWPSSSRFEWFGFDNQSRVRQNGAVVQARFYTASLTGVAGVWLRLWRAAPVGYDLVGQSDNLRPQLRATSVNTVSTHIPDVREGDYVGLLTTYDACGGPTYTVQSMVVGTGHYLIDQPAADHAFAWEEQPGIASLFPVVEVYMRAPVFVTLGDSIMSGWPRHASLLHPLNRTDFPSTIAAQLARFLGDVAYQNLGVVGATTTDIAAYFTNLVPDLRPRFTVFQGGLMDLALGTHAAFETNMLNMASACEAAGIVPVFLQISPFTVAKFDVSLWPALCYWHWLCDGWNRWLDDTVPRHSGVVIPSRQALGVYCVFGGPSNLWDLKPGMDAGDGIHLTSPANAALAQAIAQGLFDSFAPRSGPELVALRAVGGQADLTPAGRIRCLFDALLPHAEAVLELDLSPRVSGPFTLEATVQAADAEPVPATGRLQVCVEVGAAGVSAPPRLRHARSGGHLTLSWTNEDRACVLESAANLLFPVWRRDSSPQLQTDNQVTATIEAAGRERWYRLRR